MKEVANFSGTKNDPAGVGQKKLSEQKYISLEDGN
jgi:hypothetical protein